MKNRHSSDWKRKSRSKRWAKRRSHGPQPAKRFRLEPLEPRWMMDGDWQNPFNPRDANDDGIVAPIDVLLGINEINVPTIIASDGRLPDRAQHPNATYFDTDGDDFLAPIDVLEIINAINGDRTPPTITVQLVRDTAPQGESNSDRITADSSVSGRVLDDLTGVRVLTASLDGGPGQVIVVTKTGQFQFDTGLSRDGSADGPHTLRLTAEDGLSNPSSPVEFLFQLDTTPPAAPDLDLSVTSDTGTRGDRITTAARVTLMGQTEPDAVVKLVTQAIPALANNRGEFQIPSVALAQGENAFTVSVTDIAGNTRQGIATLHREQAVAVADPVLIWNQALLDAVRLDATAPPVASRGMAMVHVAILDVVNAIESRPGYLVDQTAVVGTSPEAAISAAAHRTLSYLFPAQQAVFDGLLTTSLAGIPDGPSETDGVALGRTVADQVIAMRANDGWDDFVAYVPGSEVGEWVPTQPMFAPGLLPQWADLEPFAMDAPNQFLPDGPPPLNSAEYTAAYNEVRSLGSATSTARTADQTAIARFWADGAGTYTPPGHWNTIAASVALEQGNSLTDNARLFAMLNVALADAAIVAWNAKYEYVSWRPVTAIHAADDDGNASTDSDAAWTPLLVTPPFPEYVSGHSTFSGAAAEVLGEFFGDATSFATTQSGFPGTQRTFSSFTQAAEEAGRSRIFGGIHFEFANQDGLAAGKALARYVTETFSSSADTAPPTILFDSPELPTYTQNENIVGTVRDRLSGVETAEFSIDGGPFAALALSDLGAFAVTPSLLLDGSADGRHVVVVRSTDSQGNTGERIFQWVLDTTTPALAITSPIADAEIESGAVLKGSLTDTSHLTTLQYRWGEGEPIPIAVPSSTTFQAPLDLSKLAPGTHTLTVTAIDAAGHANSLSVDVNLGTRIPFTVTTTSPLDGAIDVGATFRPRVFFSRAVNASTLNASNLFATGPDGVKLPASIVAANDGTFAWLFFDQPMSGASRITIHVDGSTIRARDNTVLDPEYDGEPGGILEYTFTTVSVEPLPGTSLAGIVADPGPDLKPGTFDDVRPGPDGVLMTADDVYLLPLAGVKVFILGLEGDVQTTGTDGRFSLGRVPAGNVKLALDGQHASNAPSGVYFPEMVMDLNVAPGVANTVMAAMEPVPTRAATMKEPGVYLPRLKTTLLQDVANGTTTNIGVAAESAPNLSPEQRDMLSISIPPGSLIGPDGQSLSTGKVGISTVPAELVRDMLPDGVLEHTFDITVQAPGISNFSTPAPMSFPNVFNAAPGTQLNFLSFDHTTGRLVIEGTATVSDDGKSVHTDPGTGITHPGWHGLTDRGSDGCGKGPPPEPDRDDDEEKPEDTEEELDPTAAVYTISDDETPNDSGGEGESGETAEVLFDKTWTAPPKTEEMKKAPPPPPPPPGRCSVRPSPKDKDKKTKQPYLEVTIDVSGEFDRFADQKGDVPLTSSSFKLQAGSDEKKTLKATLKSLKDIFPNRYAANDNYLFGVRIKITEDSYDENGTRHRTESKYYTYGLVDNTDAKHSDNTLSFERTVVGAGISRDKNLILATGPDARPPLDISGASFGLDVSGFMATIHYQPSAVNRSDKGTLSVLLPGDNRVIRQIKLEGEAAPKQELYIDRSGFERVLHDTYDSGLLTPLQKVRFFEQHGAYSTDRVTSFIDEVIANVKLRLQPYADAVEVVDGAGANTTSVNRFKFGPSDALLFALDAATGGGTLGESGGNDVDMTAVTKIVGEKYKISVAEANYRLSKALNSSYTGSILHLAGRFFLHPLLQEFTYAGMVNSMGMNITHEFGHTLGLVHTNAIDPTDMMGQGVDTQPTGKDYRTTKEALKMAVGMDWNRQDGEFALNYFRRAGNISSGNTVGDGSGYDPETPLQFAFPMLWLVNAVDESAPDRLDFGQLTAGNGALRRLRLENTGDVPAKLKRIWVDGDSEPFTLTNLPSTLNVPAHGSLEFELRIDSSAPGSYGGELVIEDDRPGGSIRLPLSAQIVSETPFLAVTEVQNNLGGARLLGPAVTSDKVFTIANQGRSNLLVTGINLEDPNGSFTLRNVAIDLASNPITLAAGESFSFGAAFVPAKLGLARARVRIATNDPIQPERTVTLVGTGIGARQYPQWGNDFVSIASQLDPSMPVLRTVSDDTGNFSLFLPPNALYHETVYDPQTDLVSHSYGQTAASGQTTDLTGTLVFAASVKADQDFDGLPDDIEFTIGTSLRKKDSDGDGLDDFTELEQGQDPLGGRRVPLGIVATQALVGSAQELVVTGSASDPNRQTAYLATGAGGLAIVDVSQFDQPVVLSQVDLPGDNRDVAVDLANGLAIVAAGSAGIHVVDIANPRRPALLRTIVLPAPADHLEIFGSQAYVGSEVAGKLFSVDLSSGELIQQLDLAHQAIGDLAREGAFLYVLTADSIQVVDLRSFEMVPRGSVSTSNAGPELAGFLRNSRLLVGNGIAYVSFEEDAPSQAAGGFATFDVSDPEHPALLVRAANTTRDPGVQFVPNGSGLGLLIGGAAAGGVVDVYNISDESTAGSFVTRIQLPAVPFAATNASGFGFLADGTAGLVVVNYQPFDIEGLPPTVAIATPAVDVDVNLPGLQLFEGSTLPIVADVRDDVQARSVELIVNGTVVRNDVSFPWDFDVVVPKITPEVNSLTVQVRATDTGGNTTLSNQLTFGIIEDVVPPALLSTSPPDNATSSIVSTVRLRFSEALDRGALPTSGITLKEIGPDGNPGTADDTTITLRSVQTRDIDRTLVLYPAVELGFGSYQVSVDPSAIADRAGNHLGAPIAFRFTKGLSSTTSGQTIEGSIDEAGEQDVYSFEGSLGQRIYLDGLLNNTSEIQLRIASPSGALIEDPGSGNSHITTFYANYDSGPIELIESGTYQITVFGRNNTTGDYRFRVLDAESAPILPFNTTIQGHFDASSNETDLFLIQGNAGQRLYFDNLLSVNENPYSFRWELYGENHDYVSDGGAGYNNFSATLPVAGTYLLAVSPESASDVDFRFQVTTPPHTTETLVLGDTITGSLIVPGESDTFEFDGAVGQRLLFDSLRSDSAGIGYQLRGPSGNVDYPRGSGSTASDTVSFALQESGRYQLTVQGDDVVGDYQFRLLDLDQQPLVTLGAIQDGNLSSKREAKTFRVHGEAGQTLHFRYSGDFSGSWSLLGADGNQVKGFIRELYTESDVPLPGTGTYYLVITPNENSQAPFHYRFEVTEPVTRTRMLTMNEIVSDALPFPGDKDLYEFSAVLGQRLYVDALDRNQSGIIRRLEGPTGTILAESQRIASTTMLDLGLITIPETGTYRISIGSSGSTGNVTRDYRFRVLDLDNSQTIALDETVEGSLAEGIEAAIYRFSGTQGQRIIVDSLSTSRTTNSQSEKWAIFGSRDELVGQSKLGESFEATLPANGDYQFVLQGASISLPLDYSFRIINDPEPATVMSGFGEHSGTIVGGEQKLETFSAPAGTLLYIDALDGNTGNLSAFLKDETGTTIAFPFYGSFSTDTGPFILSQSGDYTMSIPRLADVRNSGTYHFRVIDVGASATPIALGAIESGTNASEATSFRQLDSTLGQRIYFDELSNGSSSVTLLQSNGTSIDTSIQYASPLVTLKDGKTFLKIDSVDYRFRLLDPRAATIVDVGSTQSGRLDENGHEADLFQFTGNAGQRVAISSVEFSATITVFGPDGQPLAPEDDNSSRTIVTLPVDGTYLIALKGRSFNDEPIEYQLQIQNAPIQLQTLSLNETIQGTTSLPLERHVYTFAGQIGQRLHFDGLKSTGHAARMYSPTGKELIRTTPDDDQGPLTLTETGEFHLEIDGGIGEYRFRVIDLATAAAVVLDEPQSFELKPGEATFLRFHANAGERFYFTSNINFYFAYASIVRPDGTSVTSTFDIPFTAPVDGEFYIAIISRKGSTSTGNVFYRLSKPDTRVSPLEFDVPIQADIEKPGQQDIYTFTGTVGQRIAFDSLEDTFGKQIDITLISPSGQNLSPFWRLNFSDERAPVTLLENGPYQVVVGGRAATGSYAMRIQNVADAERIPNDVPFNQDVSGVLDSGFSNAIYRIQGTAGQHLFFDAIDFSTLAGAWRLFGPGNQLLDERQFSGDMEIALPGPGEYVLQLSGRLTTPISYRFQVVTPTTTVTPIVIGDTVTDSLTVSGQQHVYTFQASVGQRLYYDALDDGSDPIVVEVTGPDGVRIATLSGNSDANLGPFTLTQAGEYRLTVDGTGDHVGDYGFRVLDVATAPLLSLGTTNTGSLDPGVESDLYRIAGEPNLALVFDSLAASSNRGTWKLFGPNDQLFRSETLGTDFPQTLPGAGDFVLILAGTDANGPINYQFQVTLASALTLADETDASIQRGVAVSEVAVRSLLDAAVARWCLDSDAVSNFEVRVADLPDRQLAWTSGRQIWIDSNAAGRGWYVDTSPADDLEFTEVVSGSQRLAAPGSSASEGVDLLTALLHEMGHVLGLEHADDDATNIMGATLGSGVRRAPAPSDVDRLFEALR